MPRRSPDELEELIRRYSDMVYRILRVRFPQQPEDVDDIFQSVFLKLVENSDKLLTEAHVKFWLIRVTINASKSFIGRSVSRKTVSMDDNGDPDQAPIEWGDIEPTETSAPETELLRRERAEQTYAAVCSLSESLRNVVHLYYYESLSVREIAAVLAISEGAVKTRLSRARDAVEAELVKRGHYAGE